MNIKSISTAALYLMFPALMFKTYYQTALDATFLKIVVYGLVLTIFFIWLTKAIGYFKKYDTSITSALILSTAFMNNGNYGAPITLFAFGEQGFQYAIIIYTIHNIVISTFGVYYAAKGKMDFKNAFWSIIKMPMIWGTALGLAWQYLKLPMPENAYGAIILVGNAAVPTVMLTLGMQIAEIRIHNLHWGKVSLAVFLRLIVSPFIAWAIAWFLGVEPLLRNVMILLGAMPAAAITTIYALQYDLEPDLISSITLITTLLSVVTLSIVLFILI